MSKYHIFLALILFASKIFCSLDNVTRDVATLSELTQDALQNATTEALSWGNNSSDIYKCSKLSDTYYSTISSTSIFSKTFTSIQAHNYIYVTFDAVFLNIQKKTFSGIKLATVKSGKVDIDGTQQQFSALVNSDKYGCMTHSKSSNADGKATFSFIFNHTSTSMTMKITPSSLGQDERLGISNLKIVKVYCGDYASYTVSENKCECNYRQTKTYYDSKDPFGYIVHCTQN